MFGPAHELRVVCNVVCWAEPLLESRSMRDPGFLNPTKRYEGSVAKSLSKEIVHVVFALLSNKARVFLQECTRTQGFLAVGRLTCVGWCRVGRIVGRRALTRARYVTCGPRWAKISLDFSWRIEIAFHFNSELNFGN